MYAIFRTGGKQYKVSPGDRIRVERLPGEPGSSVDFHHVVAVRTESLSVGTPILAHTKVVGTILQNARSRKIRVLKYKRKKQYRRTTGHRQPFSEVLIKEIVSA